MADEGAGVLRVELRGGFRLDQLERLIAIISPLGLASAPTHIVLDLSGLVFIAPAALATLIAIVADAMGRGVVAPGSTYVPPRNRLVARYLDRVDFNRLITGQDVQRDFERRLPTGFRPFQAFSVETEIDQLSDSLAMAATEALAITAKDRTAVLLAITEIAQNVVDHADSPVGGFAIAQRSHSRREFEVAVADAGIGVAASLRQNPDYGDVVDDVEAISLALAPGVTANPGPQNKGVGLATIREFLRENEGTLLVRSGCGAVEDGCRQAARKGLPELRGTLVALRMQIGRPFELRLFSELAAGTAAELDLESVFRAPRGG